MTTSQEERTLVTQADRLAASALRAEIVRQLGDLPNLSQIEDTDFDVQLLASHRAVAEQSTALVGNTLLAAFDERLAAYDAEKMQALHYSIPTVRWDQIERCSDVVKHLRDVTTALLAAAPTSSLQARAAQEGSV